MFRNDRIWKLVARKLSGEASEAELTEMDELLKSDPQLQFRLEMFYKLWHAAPPKDTDPASAARLIEKIKEDRPALRQAMPASREPLKRNFMFRNYLKSSWRNMVRNKSFSLINITGLSVGMA